jgi:hypothetical protein
MALESQQKRTFQKIWTLNKKSTKVKIPESIRCEKGVEKNSPFTHDSVKIEQV